MIKGLALLDDLRAAIKGKDRRIIRDAAKSAASFTAAMDLSAHGESGPGR
ncbi:MAG: hypothetical protein HOC63_04250 [Rhodospirillales bacterium]|nr:hypothetical protein [Rhodospirillales bacterium]MBT4038892.1 hypothetical protein [Rhodospirillales bacterium]MBT4625881.1 hypothetical protein [Rhodospirillales bacterium]MBT5350549.1 hypothetical protein [Rhodospirillales bacterium]MBT5522184.1 hypothetical protein [Rhodospirillales bacterium]